MTIPVLAQVYAEARRLAVAGSVVARGGFRLKKLLPPLEAAGKQAPVFAKIAESAKAVVDGPEASSAAAVLELASLVNAVMYTQGEIGIDGVLVPVETTDLGGTVTQTSARTLKPLLEALTSTGSGRLELVKDAHARGLFRDLRLVKPALAAIDDPYQDVADLIAEHVLPMYGKAILPELRAAYDPKGTKGHPRRLLLMHAVDPAGTRELVLAALDGGSKEVRTAAVACLGVADLSVLIEQAGAKAEDVRRAAYRALAAVDRPEAVAVLAKAIAGKDSRIAADAIARDGTDAAAGVVVARIRAEWDVLPKLKDKKAAGEAAGRLCRLLWALPARPVPAAEALLFDLFARRGEVSKVKGDSSSGADVAEVLFRRMAAGTDGMKRTLARAHADLDSHGLALAVQAGRAVLPPAEVYDLFTPYLTPAGKAKDAAEKARAVIEMLGGESVYRLQRQDDEPPFDPRWLDRAVQIRHAGLVYAVGRPGDAAANAFLAAEWDRRSHSVKSPDELLTVLSAMVRVRHPQAAECLVESFVKAVGKANANTYWYHQLVRQLPKAAVPALEAVVPKLSGREADAWVGAIAQLRSRQD